MRERLIDAAVGPMEAYPRVRESVAERMMPYLDELQEEIAKAVAHLRSAATILNSGGVASAAVLEVDEAMEILEELLDD